MQIHTGKVRLPRIRHSSEFSIVNASYIKKEDEELWWPWHIAVPSLWVITVESLCCPPASFTSHWVRRPGGESWSRGTTGKTELTTGGWGGAVIPWDDWDLVPHKASYALPWILSSLGQGCSWRPTAPNSVKQQMNTAHLGFMMVHGCVSMLKLLVSLGTLFPTRWSIIQGLQQWLLQKRQSACFKGRKQKVGSFLFFPGCLFILILLCNKDQCRIQWKKRKIWTWNGEHWDREELGCEEALMFWEKS